MSVSVAKGSVCKQCNMYRPDGCAECMTPKDWDDFFEHAHDLVEELKDMHEYDPVDRPQHYTNKTIEVIEYIDDTVPDAYSFYMGNVIKYVSRHMEKNGQQDLLKARYYLDRMIKDWKD